MVGNETVTTREITIDCMAASAPPGEAAEVSVTKSCLQNNGRIDVMLTNIGERTESYAVAIDQVEPKVRTVAAGDSVRVTTTGRPDGPRPLSGNSQQCGDPHRDGPHRVRYRSGRTRDRGQYKLFRRA